jgi:hypothetical protein
LVKRIEPLQHLLYWPLGVLEDSLNRSLNRPLHP